MKNPIKIVHSFILLAFILNAVFARVAQAGNAPGTTNLLESPAAGGDSVVLSATAVWNAGSDIYWLHLSAANQSGTGSTNVVFTFDANGGATRTGTLTIAGQTVTVTQAGAAYVAANPVTTLAASGLNHPTGVAVDSAGNVAIADYNNSAIKQWTASNAVTTLLPASLGFNKPVGVAVDGAGNVYIADTSNSAIEKWTAASNSLAVLASAASGLAYPFGVAVDGAGNVYIADSANNAIKKWTAANNSVTTLVPASSGLNQPYGVAVDAAGNVYIADTHNNAIKQWTAANNSVSTLVASGLNLPTGLAVDAAGNVYIVDSGNNAIKQWTATSGSVTTLATNGLNQPYGVAVDGAGNVYVADAGNNAIKELPRAMVDPTAKNETCLAGGDVLPVILPATQNLTGPFAPASDSAWLTIGGVTNGVVNFAFTGNTSGAFRTGNISLLGQTIAVTQQPAMVEGPAAGSDSVVFTANTPWTAGTNAAWLHLSAANQSGTGDAYDSTKVVFTFDANGGATRTGALTIAGQTVAVTQAGASYVAVSSTTPLVAAGLNNPRSVAVDAAGNVYIADSGNSAIKQWTATNSSVTTLVASGLYQPYGVAVDGAGNVYIADSGNSAIKKWTATNSSVTTLVAAGLNVPAGVAVYGGRVYIANTDASKIDFWGIYSFAPVVASGLNQPYGVAVDSAGNVYIADTFNYAIKKLTVVSNTVTTLVSSGLNQPCGVAVDSRGNVYIADAGDNSIQQWTAASNSLTPLVSSGLNQPYGVAVDGAGNVYIADAGNNAIKELPRAFVDSTAKTEPAAAGSDVLSAILPATQNLTGPFAPASDSAWLTVGGATDGVVRFAFTDNTGVTSRTGNITVLGRTIAVTQARTVSVTPPTLKGGIILSSGAFQMSFTAPTGAGFTVLRSTNLTLSVTNWTVAGAAVETPAGSGQYQFADPSVTRSGQSYYRVRSP